MKRRAIFLDRDGTLNHDAGYVHRVEDLRLLDNAVAGLTRMAALDYRLFIVTNQAGIARGYFSEADMQAFNQALVARLMAEGIVIDAIYHCPFHPTAGIGRWRRDSPLRKPRPGMMLQAAHEHQLDLVSSFVIGDKTSDVQAGRAAGCRTILISDAARSYDETSRPDFVAVDLLEAAQYVERPDAPIQGPHFSTHVMPLRDRAGGGEVA
jgi:D-glycero-D-manno-heptose 1,7-bisphosphate phosphatase